jgi:HEAT repeat protein
MSSGRSLQTDESAQHWIERLRHADDEERWRAVDALRHVAHASQFVGLFIAAMRDSYWPVRALAAHALYDMAHWADATVLLSGAIVPLAEALRDDCTHVSLNAAYTLELLGPIAKEALPQLEEAVKSDHEELRKAAIDAINRIDRPS